MKISLFLLVLFSFASGLQAKTLKALQIAGGCCHDYNVQKDIIKEGLESRLDIEIDTFMDNSAEKTKAFLSKEGWDTGYDLVIYNFCQAKETDKAFIESICKKHHDGLPGIAIHCTMHSYHWKIEGVKEWTKMLGVVSPNHGPKSKIQVDVLDGAHPVMKGLPASWTTPQGELYNIKEVLPATKVLANGTRLEKGDKAPQPLIWVNQYGKGRVFGTTLGHHNETMMQKEYMDLLVNATEWTTSGAGGSSAWKTLFDGKTLKNWSGDPKFWSVQDGAITGITTKENPTKGNTFIILTKDGNAHEPAIYGDFELKLKYRITGHNSGIQYRSFLVPNEADGWRVGGYQSDMDVGKTWAGTNYGEKFRGILAKRGEKATLTGVEKVKKKNGRVMTVAKRNVEKLADSAELAKHIKDAPEWNEMHIIAKGNHLIQKINGVVMSEVIDEDIENRRDSGLIAVQLHGGPPMKIQVKDIQIKE